MHQNTAVNDSNEFPTRKTRIICLAAIVLAALTVRVIFLDDGFTNENEAFNTIDLWGYRKALEKIDLVFQGQVEAFKEHLRTVNPKAETAQAIVPATISTIFRPGYTLLTIPVSFITGPNALAGKYLSCIFALLTIIILYLFARKAYGVIPALTGCLLLSLSGYHVAWSRLSDSHLFAAFFSFAAFYYHYLSIRENKLGYFFLGGIFQGYSIVSNIASITFLPLFLLLEAYLFVQLLKPLTALKRGLAFMAGLVIPLLLIESMSQLVRQLNPGGMTYLERIHAAFIQNVVVVSSWYSYSQPLNFLIYLLDSEGPVVFTVILSASVAFLLNRKLLFPRVSELFTGKLPLKDYYLEIFLVFYLVFWLYASITNANHYPPRAYLYAIPFLALWGGKLMDGIRLKYGGGVLLLLLWIFVVSQTIRTLPLVTLKTGFAEAADFVRDKPDNTGILSISNRPIYTYYLGSIITRKPRSVEDLKKYYQEQGIRYFVADWQALWFENARNDFYYFEKKYRPVKIIENPRLGYLPYVGDAFYYPRDYLKIKLIPSRMQTLRIYDLKEVFSNERRN